MRGVAQESDMLSLEYVDKHNNDFHVHRFGGSGRRASKGWLDEPNFKMKTKKLFGQELPMNETQNGEPPSLLSLSFERHEWQCTIRIIVSMWKIDDSEAKCMFLSDRSTCGMD